MCLNRSAGQDVIGSAVFRLPQPSLSNKRANGRAGTNSRTSLASKTTEPSPRQRHHPCGAISPGLTAQGRGGSRWPQAQEKAKGRARRPYLLQGPLPTDGHVHPFLFLAQILLVTRELTFTHKPGNNTRIHGHQNTEHKEPGGCHTEMGKNVGLPLPNRYVCECVCM